MRKVFLACSMAVVLALGCRTVHYLEEETPAGTVPPAAAPPAARQPPAAAGAAPRPREPQSYPRAQAPSPGLGREEKSATVRRFEKGYQKQGAPRMAVFLNRELSDKVREWRTAARRVASGTDTKTETKHLGAENYERQVGAAVYGQQHMELPERPAPAEAWMWAFEDGFLRPFLRAGGNMVDRATILRLAAADSGEQGSAYEPLTVKSVEIDALRDHADVFIEILVTRSADSPCGYEFVATAKEVDTGRILAKATSLRWPRDRFLHRTVVAGPTGYEFKEELEMADIPELSMELALHLMDDLAAMWTK